MPKMMSSLEWFEKLRKKYREIVWYAKGFTTGLPETVVDCRTFQNERLLLVPGYLGQKDPIPSIGYMPEGQMYSTWLPRYGRERGDWHPSFNIRRGGLVFDFTFDPAARKDLIGQLEEHVLRALYDGPFKERSFFMDPKFELRHPSNKPDLTKSTTCVEFSHTGDAIPGLCLGEVMVNDWTFFMPESPERTAIQMLIDLEQAEAEQKKYHQRDASRNPWRRSQCKVACSFPNAPTSAVGAFCFKSARAEAARLVALDPELKNYPALSLRAAAADRQMHLE
jgi:hypothetical protein